MDVFSMLDPEPRSRSTFDALRPLSETLLVVDPVLRRRLIKAPEDRQQASYRLKGPSLREDPMSALGQKQTFALQKSMSALPPIATAKADIRNWSCPLYPESGHVQRKHRCLLWANSGHQAVHSITSPARASTAGGTVSPRDLAVLRLIASSYLVAACTGSSAGFAPLRMRST